MSALDESAANPALPLLGRTVFITGGARRIGFHLALSAARAGADIILHHANSEKEANQAADAIKRMGRRAWVLQADFSEPQQVEGLIEHAGTFSNLYALVNNAAIFEPLDLHHTRLDDWQRHLNINLTAPFLLSRDFAAQVDQGRIVNILDWRALRPAADHFPYTISKAALAAMTQSLAAALAPRITVNGLALGAILPPSDVGTSADTTWVKRAVPAGRWANLEEVGQALLFLLTGPTYITGEIIHLDGGRHLV